MVKPDEEPTVVRVWRLVIPDWNPPSVNRLLSAHWARRGRLKTAVADLIWMAARESGITRATGRRRVSVEVIVTNLSHAPDPDNVWKALNDGLKRNGILVDDKAEYCVLGPAIPVKGDRKATIITIEEWPEQERGTR